MGVETTSQSIHTMFRDSLMGEIIYNLSGRKILKPVIFKAGYQIPAKYLGAPTATGSQLEKGTPSSGSSSIEEPGHAAAKVTDPEMPRIADEQTVPAIGLDLEAAEKEGGYIMVDWDSDTDCENPKNWGAFKKYTITIIMAFLTVSAYMASAIFTPAEQQMLEFFRTTEVKLMLGLTLFVWGYGMGPLFVSSMSESPMFGGRRYILLVGQFLFVIFQLPTALSNHLAPFVILRFLAGLATAPPLSVGPAVLTDMFDFPDVAYIIVVWSLGAVCGPFLGPLIGGALSLATWRWIFWYLLIQGGVALALMIFFMPETSERALLMRKAKRLRQLTGNDKIRAPGDVELEKMTFAGEVKNILWLPIQICLREPVLDLINLHLSLLYAVVYLYFEAFPLVFIDLYNFGLVTMGVAFVGLMVGIWVAAVVYILHLNVNLVKPIMRGKPNTPEFVFGSGAIVGSVFVPIGLFIFGWSATKSAHWMGPIIGGAIFSFGTFLLFQTYIAYIGQLYPTRFASAIASNTVLRSMIGGAFPLFGRVFYTHTGTVRWPVGWGSSILGFISMAMILLPVYFLLRGQQLREYTLKKYGVVQ